MKRIVSVIIVLCLLAASCPAWVEEASLLGKPWANPNMYTVFPARPGGKLLYVVEL